jgi:hypothetical protein
METEVERDDRHGHDGADDRHRTGGGEPEPVNQAPPGPSDAEPFGT